MRMFYSIFHQTRFQYSAPISETMMELRMQPRSEQHQRCHTFTLAIQPRARVLHYRDHVGNHVHHFDIPRAHDQLVITAESLVEIATPPELPTQLAVEDWATLQAIAETGEHWEWLEPSQFARPSPPLYDLARELHATPAERERTDPLTMLCELNSAVYDTFSYVPQSTSVDSPIEEALESRQGVCQDYAHVLIALVRELGVPCRYVSGYLFHRTDSSDRSAQDATHAWVEAFLPSLGWIGFDPTNNLVVSDRHIRTAVGRDYADVPPTRGVFKGTASSELEVAVRVVPAEPPIVVAPLPASGWSAAEAGPQTQQMQTQQ